MRQLLNIPDVASVDFGDELTAEKVQDLIDYLVLLKRRCERDERVHQQERHQPPKEQP